MVISSSESCDFTFKHYAAMLERALELGYSFHDHLTYWRTRPSGRSILLRHDIDNFMKRAVEFAKIESSLGLKATYFVRIHAEYNPFYVTDYLRLKEIEKAGHELALHSDVLEFAALTGSPTVWRTCSAEKSVSWKQLWTRRYSALRHTAISIVEHRIPCRGCLRWTFLSSAWNMTPTIPFSSKNASMSAKRSIAA